MKRLFQVILKTKYVLHTVLIVLLTHFIGYISSHINLLDSVEYSITDFDFTDLYFSKAEIKQGMEMDSTIILIDLGNISRSEISLLLDRINSFEPAVIAIDAFFSNPQDPVADSMLEGSLGRIENVIIASRPTDYDRQTRTFQSLHTSLPRFTSHCKTASAKLVGDGLAGENLLTIRSFYPKEIMAQGIEFQFGVQAALIYDEVSTFDFLQREKELELIHFRRTQQDYRIVSAGEVFLSDNLHFMKGRVVLLGFLGIFGKQRDYEDMLFTPMNRRIAGRTYPDTRGVVVHANIISMILEKDYVEDWSKFSYLFSFGILFLFTIALNKIYLKHKDNYQLVSKVITFVLISLLVWLPLVFFEMTLIKVDLRWALFYLVFAPDGFEILEVNVFERLQKISLNK